MAPIPPEITDLPVSWKEQQVVHKRWIVLACFIGEVRNQVVCVVEGQSKPWKKKGQTGIVFETLEEWEEPNNEAIYRALKEELDLTDREVVENIEEKRGFILDIDAEKERIIFTATVFLVQLKRGTQILNLVGPGDELQSRGMREVISLNWDTRPGTLLALKLAIWSYDKPNPMPFVTVKDGVETGEH